MVVLVHNYGYLSSELRLSTSLTWHEIRFQGAFDINTIYSSCISIIQYPNDMSARAHIPDIELPAEKGRSVIGGMWLEMDDIADELLYE